MASYSEDEAFGLQPSRRTLSEEEAFGQQPTKRVLSEDEAFGSPGVLDYVTEAGKRVAAGAIEGSVATPLRGFGARTHGPNLVASAMEDVVRRQQAGETPEQASQATQQGLLNREIGRPTTPVTESPLYQAGEAVSKATRKALPDRKVLNEFVGDLAGGFGSLAGNIATAAIPGVGPAAAIASGVGQGMGEAAERAVKAGATPEQQVRAAGLGSAAGATEFADALLLSTGSPGRMAGLVGKVGDRILKGFFIEGGQEGLQQGIQNLIAKGLYKPDQDVLEGVGYNALIGGIVGGTASAAFGGGGRRVGETPATETDVRSSFEALTGGGRPGGPPTPPRPPQEFIDAVQPYRDADALRTPVPAAVPPSVVSPEVVNFLESRAPQPEPEAVLDRKAAESPLPGQVLQPAMQEISSNPGVNQTRLAKLLGPTLYGNPTDMDQVSVKEMLQNSFDAIKASIERGEMDSGRIDINTDAMTRTIQIQDDGAGMTPEVLGNQFLQIAGTQKDSSRSSGGFGIAKMLFLFGNKRLRVVTMRNGKVAEMRTTGDELFASLDDKSRVPKINIRNPSRSDQAAFPKGHGTFVEIEVPQSFQDPSTGEQRNINFRDYQFQHKALKGSPLFENVEVTWNGEPVEGMGTRFPKDRFTQFANVNFEWGTARVYAEREEDPNRYGPNVHVLSNGLWQFDIRASKDGSPYGEEIPRTFYIDVSPRVKPEEPGYPFELSRQNFAKSVQSDFAQIVRYMSVQYMAEGFRQDVANFGDIEYLSISNGKVIPSERFKVQPKLPPQETALSRIKPGDSVEVKDGKLYVRGREVPELSPEELKNVAINFEELKIDQSEIDPNQVILHDNIEVRVSGHTVVGPEMEFVESMYNTARRELGREPTNAEVIAKIRKHSNISLRKAIDLVDIFLGQRYVQESFDELDNFMREQSQIDWSDALEVRSIVNYGREVHGVRFDEYAFALGGLFMRLRNAVSRIVDGYADLSQVGIGISFDDKYRGVNIVLPFKGVFLNPAVPQNKSTPQHAGSGMIGTMVHELAHHKVRSHDADFQSEFQRVLLELTASTDFSLWQFHNDVISVVSDYNDVAQWLYGVFDGAVDIRPRGKRLSGVGEDKGADGAGAGVVAPSGAGPGSAAGDPGLLRASESTPQYQSRPPNVSLANAQPRPNDNGRAANARALGGGDVAAAPRQPETGVVRDTLARSLGGPLEPEVQEAAAHADRINWLYKWTAGIDQLAWSNPNFKPIRDYKSMVQAMHLDETKIHDSAIRVNKEWRDLGAEGDRLSGFINELVNMTYRSENERTANLPRQPTQAEFDALAQKYKLTSEGLRVFRLVRGSIDIFLNLIEQNAVEEAIRLRSSASRVNEIRRQAKLLRDQRPYFPFLRFGDHYIYVHDAAGKLVHFETVERPGLSARRTQARRAEQLRSQFGSTHKVTTGLLPESAGPLIGLPPLLLDRIGQYMRLNPDQLQTLKNLQEADKLGLAPILFPRAQKKFFVPTYATYTPGYSMDFRRAYAKFFFHGGKYYAKTKYANPLRELVEQAKVVPGNKAGYIARYMQDHLTNTVLDARGDFGMFKGAIFFWTFGFVPAAATQNLSQTPFVTFPFLSAKFGDFRASAALTKAMVQLKNYYKRGYFQEKSKEAVSGTYTGRDAFQMRALDYAVRTGRITETQAPELAGLAEGSNLLFGAGGNAAQRTVVAVQEKAAFMFEMAEQFNRRVAYRAALELALDNPGAKFVDEAVSFNEEEFLGLQKEGFSEAQARAILAASHTIEQTQFNYARWARPKFMRGKIRGTLFVFKKYIQSMLYMLGQNKRDVLPRYLIVAMLVGGFGGIPGWEELTKIVKGLGRWRFGKDWDAEKEVRRYVMQWFDGTVDPDLVLHGLARRGMGIPALLDMLGSFATGTPGRGLAAPKHDAEGRPQGFAANVPFPVLDRSRALSIGQILPMDVGRLMSPGAEANRVIAEEGQRASGAVFSVGFNMYKAIFASDMQLDDPKRWEKAMPRLLGSASRSMRFAYEGRERAKGGPAGGSTVVPFDVRDTEQMMEVLATAMGYQPLRLQARWDATLAKIEVDKFYDLRRNGLLSQFHEAKSGGRPEEISDVVDAIRKFNGELPDWARGKALSPEAIMRSYQTRERARAARESGVPTHRSSVPIAREIERLYPESTVDVRRVR